MSRIAGSFFSGDVCVPIPKRRVGGGGNGDAFATVGGIGNGGLGKNFCKKSAIAYICVISRLSSSLTFLRYLTHFSSGCRFCFLYSSFSSSFVEVEEEEEVETVLGPQE